MAMAVLGYRCWGVRKMFDGMPVNRMRLSCCRAVRGGLEICARGQGSGEDPHAARAAVQHRRGDPQVQLHAGVRAQPTPQPRPLVQRLPLSSLSS